MKVLRHLRALFRKDTLDREMSEEMRHHLELQIEENIAAGMNPDEARYKALRQFGNVASIQERAREQRGWLWLEHLMRDLGYGVRMLRKNRGFTIAAVLTLGLGIGVNTAIFSLINGIMLKPLPYANPDRIVHLTVTRPDGKGGGTVSPLDYLDWERQNTVFDCMACVTGNRRSILKGPDETLSVMIRWVSARHFDIFNNGVALGRTFAPGEDQPGRDQVIILTNSFWKSAFGADPDVIGRKILADDLPYTVIGVLAPGTWDRTNDQIYRPLVFSAEEKKDRANRWHTVNARLKPGVSIEQAQAEMNNICAQLEHDFPASNKGIGVKVEPFADTLVEAGLKQSLYMLMAAVGMVLLIACSNIANLTFARGVVREREVAIRASLGAGRGRLVRQFLTESLMLSTCGSLFGLGLGWMSLKGLRLLMPLSGMVPYEVDLTMDGRVLLFALGLTALTGLVCGLAPALQATRPELMSSMKQAGSSSSGGARGRRMRGLLVSIQVMLAFVLLTGSGLLLRSFSKLQKVDMRVQNPENVTWAMLPVPPKKFPTADLFLGNFYQIVETLRALPGITDVAFAVGSQRTFQIAEMPTVDKSNRERCGFQIVTPSYFRALGGRLIKGRLLNEHDLKGRLPVVVINDWMARKYFPTENPIGKHILIPDIPYGEKLPKLDVSWEIVGVFVDPRIGPPRSQQDNPAVYVTSDQSTQSTNVMVFFIRSATNPALLQPAIRNAVHKVNPDQALLNVGTVEEVRTRHLGNNRFYLVLFEIFAGVALALAAIGIYGVVSYSVTQRTNEIGIRAALGANSSNILGLILRSGMAPVGLGLVIGLVGVMGLTRLLSSLLFGVGEHDPVTIAAVALLLGLVALIACWLPARRATKVDPMVALRCE